MNAVRPARGLVVVGAGDAVIQQPSLRLELPEQERKIRGQLCLADVLGQPDRADRVELGLGHVTVIQVADLGQVGEAFSLDRLLGPQRLLLGQRDPEGPHPVLAGRMPDHATPAAADVEQPHALAQPELPRDQVVLVELRLFQRGVLGRVAGAGVGHGRAEHPLVERVGHVVVVRDRAGVAALGVPSASQRPAADADLLRRRRDPGHQHPRPAQLTEQPEPFGKVKVHHLRAGQPGQRGVHVADDVQVPGHVRTGQPERPWCLGQVGHGYRRPHLDLHWCIGRAGLAPVIGLELHRSVGTRDPLEHLGKRHNLLSASPLLLTSGERTSRRGRPAGRRCRIHA